MGDDPGQRLGVAGAVLVDDEGVVDRQFHLGADAHPPGELHEAVQGVVDHAFGGVLHRHDTEVDAAVLHLAEHLVDGGQRRVPAKWPNWASAAISV